MDDIETIGACNCFALRQATRFVTQIYERHLSAAGVTPAQFSIIAILSRRPDVLMSELADALVMDRTTLLRALKPLQRDGLVASAPSDHDPRAHVLNLTKQGVRAFGQAKRAWQAAQREFEAEFGEQRAQALRDELLQLTGKR
ncbi:MarR family transcriptional regulator [Burkholderia multivorans]|uniref:MarR family transcriptional regulator n=1 Tax=Burkholderia multivorans TaxID=87883 RepID=A0AB37AS50_9BURK|nr:MarR family winged helix-turn-helix transcriptional regulator [Burkholderia multivorans]KVT48024.1 MarR family transcriptional regulator [Burkholderia multivorans]KVZ33138.1 MarR family transcriptional regulator [Burkholderia multivorans]MBJ9618991.1 winged helix-turn-helix transcriptional regulator [Burkholderia multivorans]MBJ9654566.1 winged helix-turn-helix transcriptional regulator [Burkholderia multivorans]MBJ9941834.1 winged helix-turn-helix transcriptional regulator [Burkholderia mu